MNTGPLQAASRVKWRLVLIWASLLMGVLELASAFIISFPTAAIAAVIIFLAGAYRLSRRSSKLVVAALGIFHLIEVVFGISFLGQTPNETGGLPLLIPILVVGVAGVIAAAMTMREESHR